MADITIAEHTANSLLAAVERAEVFVAARRRKVEALAAVPEEFRTAALRDAATFCAPLGSLVEPGTATRSGEPRGA